MGDVFLKDKPEADDFEYVYAEVDGAIRRIPKSKVYSAADWEATAGETGYILNKPFGSEITEILLETEFESADAVFLYTGEAVTVVVGNEYIITLNGVEYASVCKEYISEGVKFCTFGNQAFAEGEDTGENYFVIVIPEDYIEVFGGSVMVQFSDPPEALTASIKGEVITPLDNKYLDLVWIPCVTGETQIMSETSMNTNVASKSTELNATMLTDGEKLIVYYDGERYETNVYFPDGSESLAYAGNMAALEAGEFIGAIPFCLMFYSTYTLAVTADGELHTYAIFREEYSRLPEAMLPEGVEPLPEKVSEITFDAVPVGNEDNTYKLQIYMGGFIRLMKIATDGTETVAAYFPPIQSGAEGYVLQIVNGVPTWVDPSTITTGTSAE